MKITIDAEFGRLIPDLLQEELGHLEANILRDGCREPFSVWRVNGKGILLDGHNRYKVCEKHGKKFEVVEIEIADRDHAKLWICERQLGRRNITDDQRAVLANEVREHRAAISRAEQARSVGRLGGRGRKKTHAVKSAAKLSRNRGAEARESVAKSARLPERKLRLVQEIKKAAPGLVDRVRAGELRLVDAKKVAVLESPAREVAIRAIDSGEDVRAAIRTAKKKEYIERVSRDKPKALEGKYRILYTDPPWKYVGLNQADEYGHAERHYECLTDKQLCDYRVGGKRLVRDLTDDSAVLFLWVTSPLPERCFAVIKAWGFQYKASFVWDKVKHNMGHYNSVRHEFLLICTKGSCKPDVPKLLDSVQSIERTKHSEKPERFYEIIESLYDHGRRLELFARKPRDGWDSDGNEVHCLRPSERPQRADVVRLAGRLALSLQRGRSLAVTAPRCGRLRRSPLRPPQSAPLGTRG